MLGKKKVRQESLFSPVRRETRISRELNEIKGLLDFEWLREACRGKFCDGNGRSSIAPEVLGAMMFLGFWYNITSDRELCEECEDRLSFREFIGLGDDELVPVHSSLTHWRQRLGREVFEKFLEATIRIAGDNGLHPGRCRMFDSTLVKAQADACGPGTLALDPVVNANDYLDALGEWEDPKPEGVDLDRDGDSWRGKEARRKLREGSPIRINSHDTEARYLWKPNQRPEFYQKCHFEFDASSGLVMGADAGHVGDVVKMVEMLAAEPYPVDTVAGDCGYFSIGSQLWLEERGITSHISVHDKSNNAGRAFGLDAFVYLAETDEYVCPDGHVLKRCGSRSSGKISYRTAKGQCKCCQFRDYCFRPGEGGSERTLSINQDRDVVEQAKIRNLSWRYHRLRIRRSVLCEGSIATMKMYGGLGRARAVGEDAMAIQAIWAAGVHNIKKILRFLSRGSAKARASCLHILWVAVSRYFGSGELPTRPLAAARNITTSGTGAY